jgi:hypothetical protein
MTATNEEPEWKVAALGKAPTFGIKDSRTILEQRQSLPIYALKDPLVQAVKDNQVCGGMCSVYSVCLGFTTLIADCYTPDSPCHLAGHYAVVRCLHCCVLSSSSRRVVVASYCKLRVVSAVFICAAAGGGWRDWQRQDDAEHSLAKLRIVLYPLPA